MALISQYGHGHVVRGDVIQHRRRAHAHAYATRHEPKIGSEIKLPVTVSGSTLASSGSKPTNSESSGTIDDVFSWLKDEIDRVKDADKAAARAVQFGVFRFNQGWQSTIRSLIKLEPELNKVGNLQGMIKTGMAEFRPLFDKLKSYLPMIERLGYLANLAENVAHYLPDLQKIVASDIPIDDKLEQIGYVYDAAVLRGLNIVFVEPLHIGFKVGALSTKWVGSYFYPDADFSDTDRLLVQWEVTTSKITNPDNVAKYIHTAADVIISTLPER